MSCDRETFDNLKKKIQLSMELHEHSCTDANRVRCFIDKAEQRLKKKRAEVEERYTAEAEKSVRTKSSKEWEHFTLNKQ